ncbi:unnamed protein product [Larinioides sclopetarius]|uniref:Uncharacterized protein n=1 Tax=Larinioides sclopetarius TaxID=280406 RepID=A0AAV1YQZ0_9ARAC
MPNAIARPSSLSHIIDCIGASVWQLLDDGKAIALSVLLFAAAVMASGGWHEEPKIIKIIKPVHVVKVVKHIPPPVPVIKYVKLYHSTHVGHGYGGYGGHGHGW